MTLARLERVALRAVWQSEASDFTPWLASEHTIAILSETLGLDLDVEAVEKDVGPFRADILCRETTSDRLVLIENQLERTDHRHLGQVLTYAAGLDAAIIVWIAATFTDEHRKALDWLNEITDTAFQFIGLEIELWRIADSPPAPRFNIVSKPNDWSRRVAAAARETGNSEIEATYRDFWTGFLNHAATRGGDGLRLPTTPSGRYNQNVSLGTKNAVLRVSSSIRDRRIAVSVVLRKPHAQTIFDALTTKRPTLDASLPEPAQWERNFYGFGTSNIFVARDDVDTSDRAQWPEHSAWLCDRMVSMHRTFRPAIAGVESEIDLDRATVEEAE